MRGCLPVVVCLYARLCACVYVPVVVCMAVPVIICIRLCFWLRACRTHLRDLKYILKFYSNGLYTQISECVSMYKWGRGVLI